MTIEALLTAKAREAKPGADVRVNRIDKEGKAVMVFWEWVYKGKRLSYSWGVLLREYEQHPEMIGDSTAPCLDRMKALEMGIDSAEVC